MTSRLRRYGLAVVAALVAFAATLGLRSVLEPAIYLLLLAAVIVSAVYGGSGPGIVAILLGLAGGAAIFLTSPYPPHHVPAFIAVRLLLFGFVSLFVVGITQRLRAARGNAAKLASDRELAAEQEQAARIEAESARQQLEATLNSLTDIFVTLDREWRITCLNRAASQFLQEPPEQLIGKVVWDIFPDTVGLAFYREAQRSVRDQVAVEYIEFYPRVNRWFEVRNFPTAEGLTSFVRDVTERKRAEEALEARTRQQSVVAELGRAALSKAPFAELIEQTVQSVLDVLGVDCVKVLELCPDSKALLIRASVGWKAGHVDPATISVGRDPHVDYTLHTHEPVIIEDVRTEKRFSASALAEHGIVSGISVIIGWGECPFGVLAAYTTRRRVFEPNDVSFLQAVANVVWMNREGEEAQRELRKLSSVVEQTADAVLITDREGRIEYVNPAFVRLTGFSREEAVGATPRFLRSEEHGPEVYRELWETILSGRVYTGVLINRAKDGRLFYSRKTITPLRDDTGAVVGFVSTDKDVTESKRAEEAIRKSAASLAEAQRIAHLGSWEWDVIHNKLWWSDETFRIFGYQPQQFEPQFERFFATVHPDDRERVRGAIADALAGKRGYEIEMRLVRPDGVERVVYAQADVTRNAAGEALRLVGTDKDITEEKRAAEALQRSNRALRTLSASNRALAAAKEEQALLEGVCRNTVEVGGYRFAWVGYAQHDEEKTVLPVAHAGHEQGYLSRIHVSWSDSEHGRGPVGTAIRLRQPVVVRDIRADPRFAPWREAALERGYLSVLALPLWENSVVLGALTIYAAEANAFDEEEVRLLGEVTDDLAYGIHTLRVRQERARTAAELKAAREELLRTTMEKKQFYSAVIGAVTRGKLHLVEAGEIPIEGRLAFHLPQETSSQYAELRSRLLEVAQSAGMDPDNAAHLVLAAGEAVTNAIKHGDQGECSVRYTEDRVIVQVSDHGPGILPEDLPSALLMPGFSTKISLGMGYTLMLELTDRIWLATGSNGTIVQLEKWIHPEAHPDRSLEVLLERF